MFIFFAIGFALISFLFMTFYNHALRYKVELKLSAIEVHNTGSDKIFLIAMLMICLLALLLSMTVPGQWIPYTGFVYVLNWPLGHWATGFNIVETANGTHRSSTSNQLL